MDPGRPIRICGASGSVFDRRPIFSEMLNGPDEIDLIVGDWMSEGNMPSASIRKLNGENGFEESFLEVLEPNLAKIAQRRVKIAVNAGAADPSLLQKRIQTKIRDLGLCLKTAWISGDDVLKQIKHKFAEGTSTFENIDTGSELKEWPHEILAAQAYLGSFGVAEALRGGADIVVCGRVADASVCMGGAIWWHAWDRSNILELAASLIAGHLIECSTYITGGNFSGFKSIPNLDSPGLPIVEIGSQGEILLKKVRNSGGSLTRDTVKSQLLYEIQGPWYFNSDVTAVIDNIQIEEVEKDVVRVKGISGLPPPPTTKVGITGLAGYSAELHWSLVGLDIQEKAALLEQHIRLSLGEENIGKLSCLKFTTNGVAAENPYSQNAATVDFRVFAQARNREALSYLNFVRPVFDVIMCTYPGATPHPAANSAIPRPWYEYWVTLLDQSEIAHYVHFDNDAKILILPPTATQLFPTQQPSADPKDPTDLFSFGEIVLGPLGYIVHARSGDKGCNANVGLYVRHADEFEWLRSFLTLERFKELLGNEYSGKKLDRFELPNIWAVHFLCHEHLDRGINASSTYDILGKNVAEFIRARWVPLPKKFLSRGKI